MRKKKREIISCIGILCAIYSFAFRNFHIERLHDFSRSTLATWNSTATFFGNAYSSLDGMIYFRVQGKHYTRLCTYIFLWFCRLCTTRTRSCYFFALLLLWFHLFSLSHGVPLVASAELGLFLYKCKNEEEEDGQNTMCSPELLQWSLLDFNLISELASSIIHFSYHSFATTKQHAMAKKFWD